MSTQQQQGSRKRTAFELLLAVACWVGIISAAAVAAGLGFNTFDMARIGFAGLGVAGAIALLGVLQYFLSRE